MASDGDLFQKRVSWGWGKVYKAACNGTTASELTPAILRALRNMLRGELRAAHPKTLLLVEELMAALGHQTFTIRTPFQFISKAEALIHSRTPQFIQGIRETFSCDRLRPSAAFILEKFEAQTHRLCRAFVAENPWQGLIHLYPELREVEYHLTRRGHASGDIQSGVVELYRNHVSQWQQFSGRDTLRRYLAA